MPSPYSEDLRQKAIAAVKRGERKKDVSEMFNISRKFVRQHGGKTQAQMAKRWGET